MGKSLLRTITGSLLMALERPSSSSSPSPSSSPPPPLGMNGAAPERKPQGWKCMPYIIGNETCEKIATYGLTANLTVYMVSRFHLKPVAASNVVSVFWGTANFAPLAGAFVSDVYWGRFRTLAVCSVATFLGMLVLTLTAAVPQLRPASCGHGTETQQGGQCSSPTRAQWGVLLLSLALLILGAAGVRPCSLPFGVDQFDRTTEHGRRSLASFFNWYYCTTTAALLVAFTVVIYVQSSVSWAIGFGIPTGLMLLAIILFFAGTRTYVLVPTEGSVFSGIAQVLVAAFRKRKLQLPAPWDAAEQEAALYHNISRRNATTMKLPLTLQFRFLNKAAIVCEGETKVDATPADRWRLSSVQEVEEVKCLIRVMPIWAAGTICFVALTQQFTFVVLQSLKMDRHLGANFQVPPGSFSIIAMVALALFIPFYDRVLVPAARRLTGDERGITLLQRQGVGIVIMVASMVVAGRVERMRRDSALSSSSSHALSAMWLAPQLCLQGIAEAFGIVGQIEFYNTQFPEHMQTVAGSLLYCSLALSGYLSVFLVGVVRRSTGGHGRPSWLDDDINVGRVDYFYYLIAVLGVGNLLYFLVCARFYRYKQGTAEERKTSEDVVTA